MGGEVFLRPAWADAPKEYKKGGKVKKAKKAKKAKAKKAKAGDTVMLHRGNVPGYGGGIGALSGGSVHRMASPGNLYGGGLPGPLQSSYYASAPAVAHPLSRVEFIGSSDSYYNRNRVKSDDIQIPVNPSDIQPNVKPNVRFQPSRNPYLIQHPPSKIESSLPFQGKQVRLNEPDITPSVRAVPEDIDESDFSGSYSAAGLTAAETDIMYGTSHGRHLSEAEASANRIGTVFEEPLSASASSAAVSSFPNEGDWIYKMKNKYKRLMDWNRATGNNAYDWINAYRLASKQPSPQTLRRGGRVHSAF